MQCYAMNPSPDFCTLKLVGFFGCMPLSSKTVLSENVMEIVRDVPINESSNLKELSQSAVNALERFKEGSSLSPEIAAYFLTAIQGSIRTVICDIWTTCCSGIDPLMIARDPFKGKDASFFAMACRNMHIGLVDIMLDKMIEQYQERRKNKHTFSDLFQYKQAVRSSLIYLSYLPHGVLCSQEKFFGIYKKAEEAFAIDLLKLSGINPFYRTKDETPVSFASFARQSSESHCRTCDEELVNEGVRRVIEEEYPKWKTEQKMVEPRKKTEETIVEVPAPLAPPEKKASHEDCDVEPLHANAPFKKKDEPSKNRKKHKLRRRHLKQGPPKSKVTADGWTIVGNNGKPNLSTAMKKNKR